MSKKAKLWLETAVLEISSPHAAPIATESPLLSHAYLP